MVEQPKYLEMTLSQLKSYVAVSYTHLDVYKRQHTGHPQAPMGL